MECWNILEILPPEVMLLVFSNLEPEDIVSSLSVSKLWNAFHNGFKWKEAYMATFGEVSESVVDLSQKLNWRKLFFERKRLSLMRNYKIKSLVKSNDNPKKSDFEVKFTTKEHLVYQQNGDIYTVDLRALNENPKAYKDKVTTQLTSFSSVKIQNKLIVQGNKTGALAFTVPAEGEVSAFFWCLKKNAKSVPIITAQKSGIVYSTQYFINSKYILWFGRPQYVLFNLNKRCYHCCLFEKRGQGYERENFLKTACTTETCSIIESGKMNYWFPFLSEYDPDLLITIEIDLNKHFELVIWRIGQQKITIKLSKAVSDQARIRSEHITKSKGKILHHWLAFEVNNTDLYFIDLINPSYKVKMPVVNTMAWIHNENKVALAKGNTLVVYDLERAAWCSKIPFKEHPHITNISVSGGFIAVYSNVLTPIATICQWATGAKTRIELKAFFSNFELVSEKLLVLGNNYGVSYVVL